MTEYYSLSFILHFLATIELPLVVLIISFFIEKLVKFVVNSKIIKDSSSKELEEEIKELKDMKDRLAILEMRLK